jgi:hypothetical protein
MSIAAAQFSQFKEQAVREGKVFTFTNGGEYLVFSVDGKEVIPFWSSQRRTETIQKSFPKYRAYEITEMSLAEFLQWLPQLSQEQIHIGTNWSGKRLVGYDVSAQHLLAGLDYWMKRSSNE